MKVLSSLFFLLLLSLPLSAQEKDFEFSSRPKDGLTVVETERHRGQQLYGVLNGGAELYFEYGVQSLCVQKLTLGALPVKAEIWTTATPLEAFGLFSYLRGPIAAENDEGILFAFQPRSSVLQRGRFCITISTEGKNGLTEQNQTQLLALIKEMTAGFAASETTIPLREGMESNSLTGLRLVLGRLALQNQPIPEGERFQDFEGLTLVYLAMDGKPVKGSYYHVRLKDRGQFTALGDQWGFPYDLMEPETWRASKLDQRMWGRKTEDGFMILVLDAEVPELASELIDALR